MPSSSILIHVNSITHKVDDQQVVSPSKGQKKEQSEETAASSSSYILPIKDYEEEGNGEDSDEEDTTGQEADHEHEYIIQDPQGKRAKVHFVLAYDQGWPIPVCRNFEKGRFNRWPKYCGWSPRTLPTHEDLVRCSDCFNVLSDAEAAWWDEYLT